MYFPNCQCQNLWEDLGASRWHLVCECKLYIRGKQRRRLPSVSSSARHLYWKQKSISLRLLSGGCRYPKKTERKRNYIDLCIYFYVRRPQEPQKPTSPLSIPKRGKVAVHTTTTGTVEAAPMPWNIAPNPLLTASQHPQAFPAFPSTVPHFQNVVTRTSLPQHCSLPVLRQHTALYCIPAMYGTLLHFGNVRHSIAFRQCRQPIAFRQCTAVYRIPATCGSLLHSDNVRQSIAFRQSTAVYCIPATYG